MKLPTWFLLLSYLLASSGCGGRAKDTPPTNPAPLPKPSEHGKLPKRTPGGQK